MIFRVAFADQPGGEIADAMTAVLGNSRYAAANAGLSPLGITELRDSA